VIPATKLLSCSNCVTMIDSAPAPERTRFRPGNDAELDLAGEVHRSHHDDRQDKDEVFVPFGEELQVPLQPIRNRRLPMAASSRCLTCPLRVPRPVEGDRLGVVADVHQTVTEVGLLPELLEVEVDQFLAKNIVTTVPMAA